MSFCSLALLAIFYFLPFWYLGHCFSYLNGYYRHYGANPDKPIAWGVSSYGKIYNWLFFYNGYHAEHHFRPKGALDERWKNSTKASKTCKNRKACGDQARAHARLSRP